MRRRYVSGVRLALCVAAFVAAFQVACLFSTRAYAEASDQWLPSEPLVEGQRIFQGKLCSTCHRAAGDPQGERSAPDLVRDRSWRNVMQLAGNAWNHAPTMMVQMQTRGIERPVLSPEDMGKLVAYLFYLNFLDDRGDAARGRALFEQRSCSGCHQMGGHGGTVGPRLDELKTYASSIFIAQALWNHGPQMAAKMADQRLDRPRFEKDDVAHIVAFIRGDVNPAAARALAFADVGNPRAGKTLFRAKGCIKCHAIDGSGGTEGPDLGTRSRMGSISEMAGALWNHGPVMWQRMKTLGVPFPSLSDRDMADVLSYLYFVEYMGSTGNPAKGREIFRSKSCSRCHIADGEGTRVGPDLVSSPTLESPLPWTAAMWNHAPAVEKALRAAQVPWPHFEDDEMSNLVAFLRSSRSDKQ